MVVTVHAPDGTPFTDLKSYQRHLFKQFFCFKDRENEELGKAPGEIDGQEFKLDGLKGCTVTLLDRLERAVVSNLENCKVFVGPTVSSVAIRKCVGCTITVVGKEIRVSGSHNCTLRALSNGPVMLDDCHGMTIGRFNGGYCGLSKQIAAVGLTIPAATAAVQVTDFSSRDKELPTPHFTVMTGEQEAATDDWLIELPGASGPPEHPFKADRQENDPPAPANPPPDLYPSFEEPPTEPESSEDPFHMGDAPEESNQEPDPFGDSFGEPAAAPAPAPESVAPPLAAPAAEQVEDPFGDFGETDSSVPQQIEEEQQVSAAAAATIIDQGQDMRIQQQAILEQQASQRDAENAKKQATMKEKAEEELDELYDERNNRNAVKHASNREAEKALLESQESQEESWDKVLSLIDTSKDAIKAEKETGQDKSRMRSLLIQLKNAD